jgi:hypothetical protein
MSYKRKWDAGSTSTTAGAEVTTEDVASFALSGLALPISLASAQGFQTADSGMGVLRRGKR